MALGTVENSEVMLTWPSIAADVDPWEDTGVIWIDSVEPMASSTPGVDSRDAKGVMRMDGMAAATGCAACVVVFNAGAKASLGMMSGLNGSMPVFRNALLIVPGVNAFFLAQE